MTDNEIIQALECGISDVSCSDCPAHGLCMQDFHCPKTIALDLIKRQQAQIERLQADLTRACAERDARICTNNFIRSEAIKEFAERLKKKYEFHIVCDWRTLNGEIDDLVKEMVGDNDD